MDAAIERFCFVCERCTAPLEAHVTAGGTMGTCPSCGVAFTVPHVNPHTGRVIGLAGQDDGEHPAPTHAFAAAGQFAPSIVTDDAGRRRIVCGQCRCRSAIDADRCDQCGAPFTLEGARSPRNRKTSGLATASMVLGILSVVACPLIGIVSVLMGLFTLQRAEGMTIATAERKQAWTGIILGLIGCAITAAWFAL